MSSYFVPSNCMFLFQNSFIQQWLNACNALGTILGYAGDKMDAVPFIEASGKVIGISFSLGEWLVS